MPQATFTATCETILFLERHKLDNVRDLNDAAWTVIANILRRFNKEIADHVRGRDLEPTTLPGTVLVMPARRA